MGRGVRTEATGFAAVRGSVVSITGVDGGDWWCGMGTIVAYLVAGLGGVDQDADDGDGAPKEKGEVGGDEKGEAICWENSKAAGGGRLDAGTREKGDTAEDDEDDEDDDDCRAVAGAFPFPLSLALFCSVLAATLSRSSCSWTERCHLANGSRRGFWYSCA